MRQPWLRVPARFIEGYLRVVAKRVRYRICLPDSLREAQDTSQLEAMLASGPTLIPFWNAHSLLLLVARIGWPSLACLRERVVAVADDSPGGLLTHILYRRLGIAGQMLSVRSAEQRLIDLKSIMSAQPHLVMAADSHGPYRRINPGFARLVRSYRGNVRPLAAFADKSFPIFSRIGMAVPLPNSTISLAIGPTIPAGPESPVATIADSLCSVLTELDEMLKQASTN